MWCAALKPKTMPDVSHCIGQEARFSQVLTLEGVGFLPDTN